MELNGGNTYKSDFKLKKNGIILRIGLSLDPFYLENRIFFFIFELPLQDLLMRRGTRLLC